MEQKQLSTIFSTANAKKQYAATMKTGLLKWYKLPTTSLVPIEEENEVDLIEEEPARSLNLPPNTMKNNKTHKGFKSRLRGSVTGSEPVKVSFRKSQDPVTFVSTSSCEDISPTSASSQRSQPSFTAGTSQPEEAYSDRLVCGPPERGDGVRQIVFGTVRGRKVISSRLSFRVAAAPQHKNEVLLPQQHIRVIRNQAGELKRSGRLLASKTQSRVSTYKEKMVSNRAAEKSKVVIRSMKHRNLRLMTQSASQVELNENELTPLMEQLMIFSNKCQCKLLYLL
eukprot:TRINITY_DN11235_c0_g1_i15.p1 TRINITY_DN11235_c0_g1~~TRINITY_DN11235_c0_g1_i15.p1  ORF type:complete len:282 (-),score=27.46 TRINITY_DN11235_c0_g1_i15:140-985(-)